MTYRDYLQSNYWQNYRKEAYKIFKYKCWFCNNSGELHLHHTRYYKTTFYSTKKIKNNLRWFLVICKNCHQTIHDLQNQFHLETYKATKKFRDIYYPNLKLSIPKSKINVTLSKLKNGPPN